MMNLLTIISTEWIYVKTIRYKNRHLQLTTVL